MRRRIVETVRAADDAEPQTTKSSEDKYVKSVFFEEGCRVSDSMCVHLQQFVQLNSVTALCRGRAVRFPEHC